MPFSRHIEQLVLDEVYSVAGITPATTLQVGLIIQCGALSAALTAGTSYTSLTCAASGGGAITTYSGASGDTILLGTGAATQVVQSSTTWAASATSVAVNSFIANQTFAAGTPFVRCDVYATAQEPTGGSYARVAVTNNSTNFPASTLSADFYLKQNGTAITFPAATGSWGTVAGFLIGDNATPGSGTVYCYGALNAAQLISSGNTPSFAANALSITLL